MHLIMETESFVVAYHLDARMKWIKRSEAVKSGSVYVTVNLHNQW